MTDLTIITVDQLLKFSISMFCLAMAARLCTCSQSTISSYICFLSTETSAGELKPGPAGSMLPVTVEVCCQGSVRDLFQLHLGVLMAA